MDAARRVAQEQPGVRIVYPVHLSPYVQQMARDNLGDIPNVELVEPLGVVDMHNLMERVTLVMTDSGGIQEEAPSLGKPVLVLRRETERPEAVAAGTVRMAGVERNAIAQMALTLLRDPAEYRKQVLRLRTEYAGRMEVLLGIEQDSQSVQPVPDWADYWIGSVHNLYDPKTGKYHGIDWDRERLTACRDQMFGGDMLALTEGYYRDVAAMADRRPAILGRH